MPTEPTDLDWMGRAVDAARKSRLIASPNPWVGCVVVNGVHVFSGNTQRPGGQHAERVALSAAGRDAAGATLYTTLEPCSHYGRTGPCTDAIIEAGVSRVVVGVVDPDDQVAGTGVATLRAAGITVDIGVGEEQVTAQLRPYLHHRRTGRPWVILKLAATLDGRTAAPDGTSQWITGPEARADGHRLRAMSDAILVGAGTLRADNPSLDVRDFNPPDGLTLQEVSPRRFVLGAAPADAKAQPITELSGALPQVLDLLGEHGLLQVLVEGGATVAHSLHAAGLVNEYVLYLAPALMGGEDGRGLFVGDGAATMADLFRGTISDVTRLGNDIRITLV